MPKPRGAVRNGNDFALTRREWNLALRHCYMMDPVKAQSSMLKAQCSTLGHWAFGIAHWAFVPLT